jgi:serine/threonine-protein kinase
MSKLFGLAEPALALRLEQARRWRIKERVPAEEYLARHPELNANPEYALEVVYGEVLLREEEGEMPRVEEFLARFPQFASQLQRLFDVHSAVRSACLAESRAAETPKRWPGLTECGAAAIRKDDTPRDGAGMAPGTLPSLPGYEICEELGYGGMGVVYRARQVALDRMVALKMIRGGALAGPDQVARFRTEALAVALLRHPHIVQIYDVGEQGGCPFLALEFIEGGSLAQKLHGTPLPARQAAELVEPLARAMNYAHKQGIVHRDLKPANVLLTADGTPKITDFGLAKQLEGEAGPTASGELLGTPSYMAPEQTRGKTGAVGPAADVYALGAMLYECLTGRPPFLGDTALETLEQARCREPASPRLLQPKVPRDLETVCLKCLEKEPQRRYASAGALADDLGRFLAGKPILARPIRAWARGIKWARRKPALASLLAVSALAAVTLLAVILSYTTQLRKTNDDLNEALANAEDKRLQSNESFRWARLAVDDFATKVSEDKRLKAHDLEGLRKELLQAALNYYKEFVKQRPNDSDVEEERARAFQRLGLLTKEIGRHQEAIEALREAVDSLKKLAREHPGNAHHQAQLAAALNDVGMVYIDLRQSDLAEASFRDARDIRQQLTREHPTVAAYQSALADCWNNLAVLYGETGRPHLAETAHEAARDVWEKLTKEYPEVEEYKSGLVDSHFNLGLLYEETDRLGLAEKSYRQSCNLARELIRDHPAVPAHQGALAKSLTNLGLVYVETARPDQAVEAYREALGFYQKLTDDHPKISDYRDNLARLHHNLGQAYEDLRRPQDAERAYGESRKLREQLVRDYPDVPDYQVGLGRTQHMLGLLLCSTGRPAQAGIPLSDARKSQEKLARDYPTVTRFRVSLGNTYSSLGLMEALQGKRQTALDWYEQAVRTLEAVLKQEPRQTLARRFLNAAYGRRVETLAQLGRHEDALRDLDRVLQLADGVRSDSWRLLHAITLARLGQHAPAMAEADALADRPATSADTLYNLACVCALCSATVLRDGQMAKPEQNQRAEQCAARAVELLKKAAAAGFFKTEAEIEQMQKDKDLEPLRRRRDFQEWFESLRPKDQSKGSP